MDVIPADGHVHSEWSWDAPLGAMEETCARAVEIGLPAIAFTEHADFTTWKLLNKNIFEDPTRKKHATPEGMLVPPRLDVEGYRECLERCRAKFPGLRIIHGVELGESHWVRSEASALLHEGGFERVLGSLHCLPVGPDAVLAEVSGIYLDRPADQLIHDYLAEITKMINGSDLFGVLAHLDYPTRAWPASLGPFNPSKFEEGFRYALSALAATDRALEVNTRNLPFPELVKWFRDEGGRVVTFGSDSHQPGGITHGFREAVDMVESFGFRPGRHPYDRWTV
ncbi:PHP domain-containing protein [Actinoplanes sp. TFC3]|uniref:PHP domain-containing protein n=1 Tax=Actinoplanes sp. TFC3 TaxID=1710355 RepID=UPI0008348722|nr:PHP domain-containing protein [Actinoplanes sp. TFC3]